MIKKYYFIILVLLTVFSSCKSKIENVNEVGGMVTFSLLGIEEGEDELLKTSSLEGTKSDVIYSELVDNGVDDYLVSFTEEKNENDIKFKTEGKLNKIAATVPMGANVNYRVVIYEGTTFKASLDGNSNTALIYNQLSWNKQYNWFAYSYNNGSAIAALNSTTTPTLTSTANGGLLYASGQFTTSNTTANNRVNITFKRKTSAIEFVVNGRGIFDKISNVQLATTLTGLKSSGQFDLKTGNYTSFTAASAVSSYANSAFNQFSTSSGDTIRSITLYTVDGNNPIPSFTLTYSNLAQPTDLNFAPVSRSKSFTGTNAAITVPAFTPTLGKRYRLVYTPLYRAFTLTSTGANPTAINTALHVKWALGNLYFDNSRQAYAFLHYNSNYYSDVAFTALPPSPAIIPRQNLYWKWRALKPGGAGVSNTGDPCSKVYPAGLWKTPSLTDFASINLITPTQTQSVIPRMYTQHSADPLRYIEIRTSTTLNQPFEPYNWQEAMALMQIGYYDQEGNLAHYRTTSDNRAGVYLWSNSSDTNVGLPFSITSVSSNTSTMNKNSTQILSANTNSSGTEIFNTRVTNEFRLNIRCIRDATFSNYVPQLPK